MATLNQIVTEILDITNRPHDTLFKERLKLTFKHERSTLIRQALNKYNDVTLFKQRYTVAISTSTLSDSLTNTTSTGVRRTTNKIYKPIRYNTDVPFNFVGSDSGTVSYLYTELSELPYISELPNNALAIRYTYRNEYIYIYGSESTLASINYISIESPLELPESVIPTQTYSDTQAETIYNDDMEFPIPDDMIQDIKNRILSGELRVTDSSDKIEATHLDNE